MSWSNGELATAATAVIAFAGLLRPEIAGLLRRWRAIIDLHPAGNIEIGFSNFGPTVGMQGTLRAVNGDEFVSFARIIIERVADHLRHEFDWAIFRPQAFSTATIPQQTFEIAAGFYLNMSAPRRFNIQFHDSATADKFRQSISEVRGLWMEHLRKRGIVLANTSPNDIREEYNTFHDDYLKSIAPLHQSIEREFYWNEGPYWMTVELKTTRPEKKFTFEYKFSVAAADSELLRLNAIACLVAGCDVPDVVFNFAYLPYARK